MWVSTFEVKHLDCPCEESLIRLKMQEVEGIKGQEFDLVNRRVRIYHEGEVAIISSALETLALGSSLLETVPLSQGEALPGGASAQEGEMRRALWWVLGINLGLFVLETLIGWLAGSMGLVADSLDMLADASVYGLSLWVIGATAMRKRRVARWAGYLQIGLALVGLVEVSRRALGLEAMPDVSLMISTATLALVGNSLCLWLLQRTRSHEAHIQASVIFSSNDVVINLGLILAGGLVWLTESPWPDLIIGLIVFLLVSHGAWRILRLS